MRPSRLDRSIASSAVVETRLRINSTCVTGVEAMLA
jgi:hypothetical protein